MIKKKIFALSLTVLMAVSAVGCNAPTRPDAGGEGSGESKDGKVELTFMGWEASPLETQAVKDGIAAFEEQNPDITVSYTPGLAGAEYNAKILSSAAAGALPDVMFIASESYREVVSKGDRKSVV